MEKLSEVDSRRSHAKIPMNDNVKSYYDKLFIDKKKIKTTKGSPFKTHLQQIDE
jgi:hypothetical protein